NSDYNSASGTASFAPGETTTTVNINILSDTLSEGDETFYVNLSNPTLATISDNQSEITITDGDAIPTVSISDATTSDETAGAISTTVILSNPSVSTISLNWATSDDTAIAGEDYNTAGGVLIFNPGEVSHTVPVTILADDIPEGIEAFEIILSNVTSGAIISDDTAVITITDDDGHPTISTEATSASEGSSNAMIDVELSHSSPLTISVDYATVNSSAIAGKDYTSTSGTLTFNPGEESKSISIPVLSDNVFEPTEKFKVILSNPVNATIAVGTSNVTLTDDDKLLSPAQSAVISDAILFGKNSSLRSETAFFGRILSRNTSLLASNQDVLDGPVMSFRNVQVDWSDLNEFAQGSFSFDNVKDGGKRNTSWETSVSHTKNESGTKNTFISTAFNFSRRNSKGTIYGLILGGGYSDTSMTGESIGTNFGRSLAAGVYAAYPIANSLIIDLMATKTLELNTLDTRVDDVLVKGDYNRNSTAFSVGVEGKMQIGSSEILPKFKYTVGKSVFDTGTFDIRKGALTSTQQIDFGTDEYFRFSFSPEFRTVLGNKGNLIRTYGFNRLSFRPKFFCEKYNYESSKKCGQGIGLTFGNHHPLYNFNQDFILDYDEIDGSKTYSVNYKRIY
ncbi:MAG: Calx-beta domain-containing protein, partial [Candidatus Puniceispirillaceae bacterium]